MTITSRRERAEDDGGCNFCRQRQGPINVIASTDPRVFDVRAFGAVGDGSANDTSAIQRAIHAANANLTNPGMRNLIIRVCDDCLSEIRSLGAQPEKTQ